MFSLNQVGIFFSFLSGILLARDIFGEERLIMWDRSLRVALRKINHNLIRVSLFFSPTVLNLRPNYLGSFASLLVIGVFLAVPIFITVILYAIPYWLWLEAGSTTIFVQNIIRNVYGKSFQPLSVLFLAMLAVSVIKSVIAFISYRRGKQNLELTNLMFIILWFLTGLFGIINVFVGYLFFLVSASPVLLFFSIFFISLIVELVRAALELLLRAVLRKRGLRGTFTVLGVLFFILGNILQFFAG